MIVPQRTEALIFAILRDGDFEGENRAKVYKCLDEEIHCDLAYRAEFFYDETMLFLSRHSAELWAGARAGNPACRDLERALKQASINLRHDHLNQLVLIAEEWRRGKVN